MANSRSTADSSYKDDLSPDAGAQAQAALLLLESLIHSLIDNGTLTKAQALEAIRSAHEVKTESAAEMKEPSRRLELSIGLLTRMHNSIDAHSGAYDRDPDDTRLLGERFGPSA